VKQTLKFHFVENVDQVLDVALGARARERKNGTRGPHREPAPKPEPRAKPRADRRHGKRGAASARGR